MVHKKRDWKAYNAALERRGSLTLFLDEVQAAYASKAVIHVIVDNAGYYRNKRVAAYLAEPGCRVKLRFLPAYSPNLNLIERLWHYLKKYIIGIERR